MAEFTEALGDALRARYGVLGPKRPVTHGQGRKARLNRIQKLFTTSRGRPDRRAAARTAGIPYSTWNRLMRGERVAPATLGKLESAFARLVALPAALRKGVPPVICIQAVVVCDPDGTRYINGGGSDDVDLTTTSGPAYRKFYAGRDRGNFHAGAVVRAWVLGGDQAAADELRQQIRTAYGDEFAFEGPNVVVTFHDQ